MYVIFTHNLAMRHISYNVLCLTAMLHEFCERTGVQGRDRLLGGNSNMQCGLFTFEHLFHHGRAHGDIPWYLKCLLVGGLEGDDSLRQINQSARGGPGTAVHLKRKSSRPQISKCACCSLNTNTHQPQSHLHLPDPLPPSPTTSCLYSGS